MKWFKHGMVSAVFCRAYQALRTIKPEKAEAFLVACYALKISDATVTKGWTATKVKAAKAATYAYNNK